MAAPSGTPTSLGIRTFADGDSPDLGPNGLGLILGDVNTAIGAGGFAKIAEGVVGSAALPSPAASIDFQNVPQTFRHLLIVAGNLRTNTAAGQTALSVRFNNDATNSYGTTIVTNAGGAGVNGNAFAAQTQLLDAMLMNGTTAPAADGGGTGLLLVGDYRSTTNHKTGVSLSVGGYTGTTTPAYLSMVAFHWRPAAAAAITRVTCFPDTGSFILGTISLYGLA
jgi:hypothetical protein